MTGASKILTPSTASSKAIYATLRAAILAYRSADGVSVADVLGGENVHVRAAPAPTVFPYLTMILMRQSSGASNGYRETGSLEIQCIGRPESQLPLVEDAMDLVDGCFLGYVMASEGLIFSRSRTRDTIPQFGTPADRTVVGVLSRFDLVLWPQVLTDLRPNPE